MSNKKNIPQKYNHTNTTTPQKHKNTTTTTTNNKDNHDNDNNNNKDNDKNNDNTTIPQKHALPWAGGIVWRARGIEKKVETHVGCCVSFILKQFPKEV